MNAMNILSINSGSSSLKVALFRVDASGIRRQLEQRFEHSQADNRAQALSECLATADWPAPDAIVHRLVHGGPQVLVHSLIDEVLLARLQAARTFAPLHLPAALALVEQTAAAFPGVPQVACFDTAFHADLPKRASTLPIAATLRSDGLRRYGFHGLSCESVVDQLSVALPARLVIAHLGSGASVTAVARGRSVDTSMGLTPSGGVIMGTRSGDLDPGLVFRLLRASGQDIDCLQALLDESSGLLGISGVSGDLRQLHAAAPADPDARLAIEMFCFSVRKQIAAMISVLGGVDAIVFTGGIGEHDAEVREWICDGLGWMGIYLDPQNNRSGENPVSDHASRCVVQVLPSDEARQMVRHTARFLVSASPEERGAIRPLSSPAYPQVVSPGTRTSALPRPAATG
jgi:acetate kinase